MEGARLALLEKAMLDMQKQLSLISDLCLNTVRAYLAIRAQHAGLIDEFQTLRRVLHKVGFLPSAHAQHHWRSHTLIRLFEEPDIAESIMFAGGLGAVCSLCAVSPACLYSIITNTVEGPHFRFHAPCQHDVLHDSRLPQPVGPMWLPSTSQSERVVEIPKTGCVGVATVLSAVSQQAGVKQSLATFQDLADLRAVRTASHTFQALSGSSGVRLSLLAEREAANHGQLESRLREGSGASTEFLCLHRHAAVKSPRLQEVECGSPSLCAEAFSVSLGLLALLQDLWHYSSLAEALTCMMDAYTIHQFRSVSRAGRECMRLVLQTPNDACGNNWIAPLGNSRGMLEFDVDGQGILMILDATWRCLVMAESLTSSMGVTSVRRFSAVSRAGRECMRGACNTKKRLSTASERPRQCRSLRTQAGFPRLIVKLQGLSLRPDLNGMLGTVVHEAPGDRCHVILTSGERIRVRRSNVKVVRRAPETGLTPSTLDKAASAKLSRQCQEARRPLLAAMSKGAVCVCTGTSDGLTSTRSAYCFLPDSSSWRLLPPLSTARSHACSARVHGRWYILGGHDCSTALDVTECFDFEAWEWEQLPHMSRPRCFASVAGLGRDIYVAGGCSRPITSHRSSCAALRSVERFSTTAKTWTTLPSMLEPRAFAPLLALGDSLYILGGCNEKEERIGSMERFNPATDIWSGTFSLPWKCAFGAHAAHGDYLYLCGGDEQENASKAARFDLRTEQWELLPSMRHPRIGAVGVATPAGDIFVCGGCVKANSSVMKRVSSVECFRSALGFWELFHCLFAQHSFPCTVTMGGHVYILGGKDQHGAAAAAERMDLMDESWQVLPPMPEPLLGCACEAFHPQQ